LSRFLNYSKVFPLALPQVLVQRSRFFVYQLYLFSPFIQKVPHSNIGGVRACPAYPVEYSKIHTGLNAVSKWLSHLFNWGWYE